MRRPSRSACPGGAYPHLQQIVATHRTLPEAPSLSAVRGDLAGHVSRLKALPGRDIWLCGGASLAAQLIEAIDEIQLKVNPVVLGGGIPVLPVVGGPRPLAHVASETLPGGVVLLTYRRP